jgi:hypothetical protein
MFILSKAQVQNGWEMKSDKANAFAFSLDL